MIVLRNQSAPSEPKTPTGVKSFSLGCSAEEPQERIKPIIKPLAGDTKPIQQIKPFVPSLRSLPMESPMKISISLHYKGGNVRIATATKGRYFRKLLCLFQIGVWQPFTSMLIAWWCFPKNELDSIPVIPTPLKQANCSPKTRGVFTMYKFLHVLIIILCLLLLASVEKAQITSVDALQKYQQIQSESRQTRGFKYEEGTPKSLWGVQRDCMGYLWFRAINPLKYYRFNGVSFQDVFSGYPKTQTDSLFYTSPLLTYKKITHFAGRHYLYRWNGFKLQCFAFPKDDRIAQCSVTGEKVYCLGSKGFAILDKDKWIYVRIPIDSRLVQGELFSTWKSSSNISEKTGKMKRELMILSGNNELVLLKYETMQSTLTSNDIPFHTEQDMQLEVYSNKGKRLINLAKKEELNTFADKQIVLQPVMALSRSNELFVYIKGTNLLYKIDTVKGKTIQQPLPENAMILHYESVALHNDWVVYQTATYINALNFKDSISNNPILYKAPLSEKQDETGYLILVGDTIMKFSSQTYGFGGIKYA